MQNRQAGARKPGFRLAAFGCLFAVCVIVLGAFTRLVDAGLGCPDWPVCYGHILWPMDEEEVRVANAAFPDTPVEHDKTWPEQVHRIMASSLGVICIALLAICWRNRLRQPMPVKFAAFLLGLVILQGLFGMWTVTLKLWPQVVTLHLLGGFATLSCLCLMALRLSNSRWQISTTEFAALQSVKPFLWFAVGILVMQIALGGWTTSNYAALACPDLPQCQSAWLPAMDFSAGFNIFQDIGPNYLGGIMDSKARTAIHFSHRMGAIATTVVILLLAWKLKRQKFAIGHRWAWALSGALLIQLSLGVSNVYWSLPLAVAVSHNAVGACLLVLLVALCHRVYTAEVAEHNEFVRAS